MKDVTSSNFGFAIAYLIPGLVLLSGVGVFIPEVDSLLRLTPSEQQSLGGFLYLTLATIAAGLVAHTIRWLTIDTINHWTGIRTVEWDFSRFHETGVGHQRLIEIHYRYYQFYSNSLIATVFTYLSHRVFGDTQLSLMTDIVVTAVVVILFLGSRDTLRKYYDRLGQLLRHPNTASDGAQLSSD